MAGHDTDERTINIRRPYLELIASGRKTIEVRVGYPRCGRSPLGKRFVSASGGVSCRARVAKVAEYESFEAMLDHEENRAIGSEVMSREELLAACREIYPPEKETLGVLAIHLELLAG
jgi:ASC-1-like (ASCH) protein